MKKIYLKNGKEVTIREALKEDAKLMIAFYNLVGGETDFLSFGKNEFIKDLTDYESFLETTRKEDNSIILLAEIDNKIMGIATINSSPKSRFKHVGEFGIVIAAQYCKLGLGRKIMDNLIIWANANGITKKISLVTSENNYRAMELYKKVGFQVEGTLKNDTYVNGVYGNTIVMGMIL
ncbi:GNAT family N-acetyltransferase [Clostridium tagluense]|uniref:GNAT family N-acetyltransferase n=1 Tax=Clostridium tagluense TaxID=360422 RepID=UPI001CF51167|nr:GNAT family N-acetyltransferase [Clostridium tagluense]MCB2298509.1 GNAT family N-acetyltransferase [Clostridium tagluense]